METKKSDESRVFISCDYNEVRRQLARLTNVCGEINKVIPSYEELRLSEFNADVMRDILYNGGEGTKEKYIEAVAKDVEAMRSEALKRMAMDEARAFNTDFYRQAQKFKGEAFSWFREYYKYMQVEGGEVKPTSTAEAEIKEAQTTYATTEQGKRLRKGLQKIAEAINEIFGGCYPFNLVDMLPADDEGLVEAANFMDYDSVAAWIASEKEKHGTPSEKG